MSPVLSAHFLPVAFAHCCCASPLLPRFLTFRPSLGSSLFKLAWRLCRLATARRSFSGCGPLSKLFLLLFLVLARHACGQSFFCCALSFWVVCHASGFLFDLDFFEAGTGQHFCFKFQIFSFCFQNWPLAAILESENGEKPERDVSTHFQCYLKISK